jgi:hypothetical protein
MTRVVLHIDKLILRGIERADAPAIAAAIEAQLEQSLGAPGMANSLGELGNRRQVNAGVVDATAVGGARQLGRQAARQIVKGVTS